MRNALEHLLKSAHALSQPVVLIEADTCRERQIGADAHEDPPPVWVVEVKVVLHNPALRQLQMPALFCPDGDHDPGRLVVLVLGPPRE